MKKTKQGLTSVRPSGPTGGAVLAMALLAGGCGTPGSSDEIRAVAALAPAAVRIVPRAGTVRLVRGEHPLARPAFDQGRLDPAKRIANLSLFFGLSAEQRADRDALVQAQLDPASSSYHRWLTPESYRARFGAHPEDIARASAWLLAQGFEVHRTSRLGTRVTFSANVAGLEAAFQTEMHRYKVGTELHYAMATAPALPQDLAGIVLGLHHSHDFYPRPISRRTNASAYARRSPATPDYTINFPGGPDGGFQVLGPPDWATAYDVARLYSPGIAGKALDGTGVTLGIVGTAAIAQADINAFRTTFGLASKSMKMTLVPDTGAAAGGQGGEGVEAILDVEWSGGIAKGADVNYVFVGADDPDVDDATFYLIEENLAPVMSESYGGCEAGSLPTDADILEENGTAANLLGITYMAAAGDDGAADCVEEGFPGLYVDLPGAFPGVTSVGGTQFPAPTWSSQGNLTSAGLEQVWNEANDPYAEYMGQPTGIGAGGGGISSVFLRPAYQAGLAACAPVGTLPVPTTAPMRQVPDVALSAASETPGYYIECTFDDATQDCSATGGKPFGTPIGGTSASSPSFAGFVAILNQAAGERLGNINPILYQLAAQKAAAAPFHDIVSGSNEIACGEAGAGDAGGPDGGIWPDAGCGAGGLYGYAAVPSYDCASGIGSIDGYNLVSAWLGAVKTATVIVPMPTETAEGQPVLLQATVDVVGTSTTQLTGDVTFAFESSTGSCATDLSWELGTLAITDGTASNGHAVLQTAVPPGLVRPGHQTVDVVAFYGGDANHLPSASAKVTVSFAPVSFAIAPATLNLTPNATQAFTSTGGEVNPAVPVRWFITADTTAELNGMTYQASYIGETDGAFVAGPMPGFVTIQALDGYGAEAVAEITVGSPGGTPPWSDAGANLCAREDAGLLHDAGLDAFVKDAGGAQKDAGGVSRRRERRGDRRRAERPPLGQRRRLPLRDGSGSFRFPARRGPARAHRAHDRTGRVGPAASSRGERVSVLRCSPDRTEIWLPALASAHSHAFQRAMRGRAQRRGPSSSDDFWSWRGQMYEVARVLTPESIHAISRVAFRELRSAGVRTVGEFHYLHHQPGGVPYDDRILLSRAVIQAARDEGLRVALLRVAYHRAGPGRVAEPDQLRFCDPSADAVLRDVDALRLAYAGDSNVRIGIAPHSVRAVPPEWLAELHAYAERHALPFHMHVAEQAREVDECVLETGRRPVELLADEGVLDSRFVAVHATHLEPHEAGLLGQASSFACICATTERDLGDGLPDLTALRDANVRLCTGIDSHVLTDPFEELRALETHERLRTRRRVTFQGGSSPAAQLWLEGSLHGALACGFEDTGGDVVLAATHPGLALVDEEHLLDAIVFGGGPGLVVQTPC